MVLQEPPKPGTPLYIDTEAMYFAQIRHAGDAHKEAEEAVSKIAVPKLVDHTGRLIQSEVDAVVARLNALLLKYIKEPTHLEAWNELEGSVSKASFIVTYLFLMEYGRPFLKMFPELSNRLTMIPLLTLTELVDPHEDSLLDAYDRAFPVEVIHRGTGVPVLGDQGTKIKRDRLTQLLFFTLEFLKNKGAIKINNDDATVTMTPDGLRLLKHLQSMDLWVAAKYDAHKRLKIKETE
jgi:hypothetical protein